MVTSLNQLQFDNSFTAQLPGDPEPGNFRRQVSGACYSRVEPTPVAAPFVVGLSDEVASLLDLDTESFNNDELAAVMSGNQVLENMACYAACYGGHQFGNWAGQLGDGRAITLGEVLNQAGQRWELQLKGAGPTPYSRMGDGRAVMRSSVREFLCSEAMYHLGVPTTRALSLVGTGESVERDMFYNGNSRPEPGAVVCRVAPSFLRFGNFEVLTWRNNPELLKTLADYAITTHYPHLGTPSVDVYLQWLAEICERTATMVVDWMRVGFVHGVMNTDNMSILGLTIDYGPYGWLEGYDPMWTPNTTDASGRRYCYGRQPQIAQWNLLRLANALYPLIGEEEPIQEALGTYGHAIESTYRQMVANKLGLEDRPDENAVLFESLLAVMQLTETDMTLFYRGLANVPTGEEASDTELLNPLAAAYYVPEELEGEAHQQTVQWLRKYTARVREEQQPADVRIATMNATNPRFVLRNYLAQLAIDEAEQGKSERLMETLEVMRRPYDEQPGKEEYAAKRPEWARHRPGCSMLSCSS